MPAIISNLWQTQEWGNFQKKLGNKVWFLKKYGLQAVIIKHKLFLGFAWLDVPRGPIGNFKNLEKFLTEAAILGQQEKVIFIRIMPESKFILKKFPYKIIKAVYNHQPETTLKLDLTLSEEKLLQQMKPKGRYNLNLAQRKGVKVYPSENLATFHQLLQETTRRNQFAGHSFQYYQILLESFSQNAVLYLAEYQQRILAGGIFIFTPQEGIYYYGASSSVNREAMAPYLLQWTAICEAKKRGCEWYDFLGIAPEKSAFNHPWKGVTDFKKKFGGIVVNYSSAQEIILKPFWYQIYRLAKKLFIK